MVLVTLQTELSNREGYETILVRRQAMPLREHIKSGHGERQMSREILPDAVHHLLEVADQREHRQHGCDEHAIIPFPALTQFQVGGIPRCGMEGEITQDEHVFLKLPDERLKARVMHIGGVTRPGHDQAEPIQQQAQLAAHNPAVIREPLTPDLPEAAAFPYRMDQLDPIGVNDAQQGGSSPEALRPVLMRREQPKEPGALGQVGEQRPVVPRQPSIKGAGADTFEACSMPKVTTSLGHKVAWGCFGRLCMWSSTWQNKAMIKSIVVMCSSSHGKGVTLPTSLKESHDHFNSEN